MVRLVFENLEWVESSTLDEIYSLGDVSNDIFEAQGAIRVLKIFRMWVLFELQGCLVELFPIEIISVMTKELLFVCLPPGATQRSRRGMLSLELFAYFFLVGHEFDEVLPLEIFY